MMEVGIDRYCPCPCYKSKCTGCPVGFEKVVDLKDAGLVIYHHTLKTENKDENIGNDLYADESAFLFHNTKDEDIISKDFLPEMEKKATKCTRCRQIMEHAIKILQKVSAISKNEIIGVCDHCKSSNHPCCQCKDALKIFFEGEGKEDAFNKERISEWSKNIQNEFKGFTDDKEIDRERLKDYIEKYKRTAKKRLRTGSEVNIIDRLYRQEYDRGERELEIKELCRDSVEQHMAGPSPALADKNKKQIVFNFDDQLNVLDSTLTILSDTITKSTVLKVQRSGHYENDIIPAHHHIQYAHDIENLMSYEEESIDKAPKTGFIYRFPPKRKIEEKYKREKNSSELISDINDRIQIKQEEIRLNKIEKEERKQSARQKKNKLTEEKKRLAEETKLIEKRYFELAKDGTSFEKSKNAYENKTFGPSSSTTVKKIRHPKSKSDLKGSYSKSKLRVSKSETKESKQTEATIKSKKAQSESKLKSKQDQSRVSKYRLVDSNIEQKTTKSKPEGQLIQKTDSKHPKAKSEDDSKQLRDDIKQPKGDVKQPKSDIKQPKDDKKQSKAEPKSDLKQDKGVSKELKSDPKQVKPDAELKTGLKQLKSDAKAEPKSDLKQDKGVSKELKSDPKQVKPDAELKTGLKQPKSDAKTETKELKAESKEPKSAGKDLKSEKKESKLNGKESESEGKKSKLNGKEPKSEEKESKQAALEAKFDIKQGDTEPKPAKGMDKSTLKAQPSTRSEAIKPTPQAKEAKSESKEPKVDLKGFKVESNKSKADQIDFSLKSDSKAPTDSKETKNIAKTEKNFEKSNKEKEKKEKSEIPKIDKSVEKEKDTKKKDDTITIKMEQDDKQKNIEPKLTSDKEVGKGKQAKDAKGKSPDESKIPRRQLELAALLAAKQEPEKPPKKEKKEKKTHSLINVKVVKRTLSQILTPSQIYVHEIKHMQKDQECPICTNSYLELEYESRKMRKIEEGEMIKGRKIRKCKVYKEEKEDHGVKPILFQIKYDDRFVAKIIERPKHIPVAREYNKAMKPAPILPEEESRGVISYALSDRTFIDKGWTMLPTEKVVRKMNVYRMRPAHPEFDWFQQNRNKRLMTYDTGERFAEFDDDGRGRWFYRNQRLALQYYDAEELNAQQRFVIFSNGEPDERGRTRPYTVLATFDYLGNGIVFDHGGKIRLKYNQTEGVVLDRNIGPVTHWKWHTLNDPPVLQQVMIDTHMPLKDPQILKMATPHDKQPRQDNEEMLSIEFDNFLKEKSKKLTQSFKPFQIRMKAMKINENFSLKVLDQANVYLIYRDGTTNIKLNLGMLLDHKEIVDTDTAEVGEVASNLERLPALTDSLAAMQKSVEYAKRFERNRTERERRLRPLEPSASADKLVSGISRPIRLPLCAASSSTTPNSYPKSRKPSSNNVYYDSRLL